MEDKLNVLMVTPDFPPDLFGGIGSHVNELTQALIRKGCKVTVIVARCDLFVADKPIEEISDNLRIIRFPVIPEKSAYYKACDLDYFTFRWAKNDLSIIEPILDFIKDEKYDILHTHDLFHVFVFDAIKRIYKIPTVTTIHARAAGSDLLEDYARRYMRINSNRVISISKHLKAELEERYGNQPEMPIIEVIYNGIRINKLKSDMHYVSDNGCKYITFCGRLAPLKGCDILIHAFAKMIHQEKIDGLDLKILGDGPLRNELLLLAQKLKIDNRIQFCGFIPESEVRPLIGNAYFHVVPSLYECFGLSALEAMAEGRCVIASNVGGLIEFIKDGYNGKLVPPNNIDALARSMYFLYENPSILAKYAERGFKTATDMSWDEAAQKTLCVYQSLVKC